MKNILVPIGSNENALNTLQYAIDFSKEMEARIYLIHVYSSPKISGALINVDQIIERDSRKILDDHLEEVDQKDVEIVTSTLKGHSVTDTLKQLNKLLNIDLIIASAKNDGADENVFIGKITGRIIKDTKVPVLVVPDGARFTAIDKILMTIKSGRIKSEETLTILRELKAHFNSSVQLLQVQTPKLTEEDLKLNEYLDQLVDGVIQSKNATVFQGVLAHFREQNPDLLCVIRRKRGFFQKLWEDDRVKKIDFDSQIPLLVLKGMP